MGFAMADKKKPQKPAKAAVVPVKLHSRTNEKLKVIAAYLATTEGAKEHLHSEPREVSLAEAHDIAAIDAINAFYMKALRKMQEAEGGETKK